MNGYLSILEEQAQNIFKQNVLHFVAFSMLYYDHALTLRDEIAYIWRRPRTLSAIGFLLNRYVAFGGNIFVMVLSFHDFSMESCLRLTRYRELLLTVNSVLVSCLILLRTYALYNCSKVVLAFMLVVGTILLCVALAVSIQYLGKSGSTAALIGCHTVHTDAIARRIAAPWEAQAVWDVLMFVMTLGRTLRQRHRHNLITAERLPLASLVLRDGALYFIAITLANTANLITFYTAPPLLKGSLSTLSNSIAVTMSSRLTLNVHIQSIEAHSHSRSHEDWTTVDDSHGIMLTSRIASNVRSRTGSEFNNTNTSSVLASNDKP